MFKCIVFFLRLQRVFFFEMIQDDSSVEIPLNYPPVYFQCSTEGKETIFGSCYREVRKKEGSRNPPDYWADFSNPLFFEPPDKVCARAKWPIRPELIPVSVA